MTKLWTVTQVQEIDGDSTVLPFKFAYSTPDAAIAAAQDVARKSAETLEDDSPDITTTVCDGGGAYAVVTYSLGNDEEYFLIESVEVR